MLARAAAILVTIVAVAHADKAQAPRASRPPPLPPPPPAPFVPPAEIAALAKQLAGTYTCKGVQLAANGSSTPLAAKVTIKLALGGAWIATTLAETKSDGLVFDEYRTYDPIAKQWTRIQMASTTGHVISTSLGDKAGIWTWEGTATSQSGTMQLRDYEQPGDRALKLWGEALLGGAWQKLYEVTCSR